MPVDLSTATPEPAAQRPTDLTRLELAALRTVARAVADGMSLDETVRFCLDETLSHLGLDFGCVYLRKHDYLLRNASRGLMVPGGPEGILPLDDAEWAKRPLLVSQGAEADRGHLPAGVSGKAWMSLPLRVRADLVGVMIVGGYGRLPSELPPLATALRVSEHIAAAIDNAARFETVRGILNDTRDVIFRTDAEGRFTVLNDAWQETIGEPVHVALGRRFAGYVAEEQRRYLGDGVHYVVPKGCVIGRRTLAFCTADGNVRHLDVLARLLSDDRGRVVGTAGVLRDVSRTVRQAKALAEANAELRERAVALEAANRELAEADRLKSEFLATVSHELKTPLGIMLGYTEMLSDGLPDPVTPGQYEYLHAVQQSGHDLRELISNVLDLACIEAGRLVVETVAVRLDEVIELLRARVARRAHERGVTVELPAPDLPYHLTADADRLVQVLDILIDNAIKFSPDGATVTVLAEATHDPEPRAFIEADDDGGYIALRVIDQGIGIAPEQHELLFRKFAQGDGSATRQHGGLGIGLVIARELAERMGGRLDLFSAGEGHGATAALVLPRVDR